MQLIELYLVIAAFVWQLMQGISFCLSPKYGAVSTIKYLHAAAGGGAVVEVIDGVAFLLKIIGSLGKGEDARSAQGLVYVIRLLLIFVQFLTATQIIWALSQAGAKPVGFWYFQGAMYWLIAVGGLCWIKANQEDS